MFIFLLYLIFLLLKNLKVYGILCAKNTQGKFTMKEKTIAEILNECNTGDVLSNGIAKWNVKERYYEDDNSLVVVAQPDKENDAEYQYELWNCASELHSYMPNLSKV